MPGPRIPDVHPWREAATGRVGGLETRKPEEVRIVKLLVLCLLVGCGVRTEVHIDDRTLQVSTSSWSESSYVSARCFPAPEVYFVQVPVLYEKKSVTAEKPL